MSSWHWVSPTEKKKIFLCEYMYLVCVCESWRATKIVLAACDPKTVCLSIVGLLMWLKSASNAKLYPTGHGFSHGLHHRLYYQYYYAVCSNRMYMYQLKRREGKGEGEGEGEEREREGGRLPISAVLTQSGHGIGLRI